MGVLAGLAVVAAMYALSDHRKWWLSGMVLAMPALVHHLSLKPELTSRFDVFGLVCSVLFDVFMTVFILYVIFGHKAIRRETIFGALSAYLAIGFAFRKYLPLAGALPAGVDLPGSIGERAQGRAESGFDLLQLFQSHMSGRERIRAGGFVRASTHFLRVGARSDVPRGISGPTHRLAHISAACVMSSFAFAYGGRWRKDLNAQCTGQRQNENSACRSKRRTAFCEEKGPPTSPFA